jgi:hypothetical protein
MSLLIKITQALIVISMGLFCLAAIVGLVICILGCLGFFH